MWTLPTHRPVVIDPLDEPLRELVSQMAWTAGLAAGSSSDPPLRVDATAIIAIAEWRAREFNPRDAQMGRRRQHVFRVRDGEARAADGVLRPGEMLITRRLMLAERRSRMIAGIAALPFEEPKDTIRIYLHTLWDSDELRGQLEVARDEIVTRPEDPPSGRAILMAAEALPFGYALFLTLVREECRLIQAATVAPTKPPKKTTKKRVMRFR